MQLTVYADDIIISGPKGLRRSVAGIAKLARRYGLKIHPDKVFVMPIPSQQQALGVMLAPCLHMPMSFEEKMERHRTKGDMKRHKGMLSYQHFIEGK